MTKWHEQGGDVGGGCAFGHRLLQSQVMGCMVYFGGALISSRSMVI